MAKQSWAAPATKVVELPSGNFVVVKDSITLHALIQRGVLTEDLIELLDQMQGEGLDSLVQGLPLFKAFAEELTVTPKFVDGLASPSKKTVMVEDPKTGEAVAIPERVPMEMLPDGDLIYLGVLASGGDPEALFTFRDESGGSDAGEDSAVLADDAKPASEETAD